MDSVLLFALPLVGGLIFCTRFNYTRWRAAREDGHRLYFRAVFFGAAIFALVLAVRVYLEARFPELGRLEAPIKSIVEPMVKEGVSPDALADLAITCFVSMLIAAPLAWVLNLLFWKNYWLRRAIKKDDFEALLLDAADREFPIAATMDDGKVYVGYVIKGFNPAEDRKSLLLLPLMSGYRNKETHKVTFTTFYTDLYGGDPLSTDAVTLPKPLDHLYAEDFITWLPVEHMSSCRLFDAVAYQSFQKRGPPAIAAPPPTAPGILPASPDMASATQSETIPPPAAPPAA